MKKLLCMLALIWCTNSFMMDKEQKLKNQLQTLGQQASKHLKPLHKTLKEYPKKTVEEIKKYDKQSYFISGLHDTVHTLQDLVEELAHKKQHEILSKKNIASTDINELLTVVKSESHKLNKGLLSLLKLKNCLNNHKQESKSDFANNKASAIQELCAKQEQLKLLEAWMQKRTELLSETEKYLESLRDDLINLIKAQNDVSAYVKFSFSTTTGLYTNAKVKTQDMQDLTIPLQISDISDTWTSKEFSEVSEYLKNNPEYLLIGGVSIAATVAFIALAVRAFRS